MANGILVFIERRNGVLNKTSLEAIAAAQSLGSELQHPVSGVLAEKLHTEARVL